MAKKPKLAVGVGKVVEKLIMDLGVAGGLKLVRVMAQWEKIFDPPISRVTFPRDLKGKILFVDVESSAWLQQLSFMDEIFIQKINKALGVKAIHNIRFTLGKIPDRPNTVEKSGEDFLDEITLSNDDLDEIKDCVAGVTDLELKKKLRSILLKDKKLKKYREKLVNGNLNPEPGTQCH